MKRYDTLGEFEQTVLLAIAHLAEAAYGVNYARLQRVKMKYDPENFFQINQNISPRATSG